MTPGLKERDIQCPYCGETITIMIDSSVPVQTYIEDCQVCCHPITIAVHIDFDNNINLSATHENDSC